MNQRLDELRAEYNAGRQQLQHLDRKRQQLRDTLLRISGAIQVLEEMERACVGKDDKSLVAEGQS